MICLKSDQIIKELKIVIALLGRVNQLRSVANNHQRRNTDKYRIGFLLIKVNPTRVIEIISKYSFDKSKMSWSNIIYRGISL